VQVACPQCGAPVTAQTETRFYRCAFCASAFVIQGERGIDQYTFSHQRDDRLAWSALAEHLERNRVETALERGPVEFLSVPFWCFTLNNGSNRLALATSLQLPELSGVTLPGGDLRFPQPGEEFPPPEVSLADAERGLNNSAITRRFLVHLPCYILAYTSQGVSFQTLVSGTDRKVYALTLPAVKGITIPHSHFLMIGLYVVLLVVEGLAIRRLEWRALAFVLTGLAAWPLCYAIIRRER
jgi:hypothetical protein